MVRPAPGMNALGTVPAGRGHPSLLYWSLRQANTTTSKGTLSNG
jgi:hypothetical protein